MSWYKYLLGHEGRAAKLLNCEMWDIFHWWQLGYIDLSIMVNNVHGLFAIQFNDEDVYKKYFWL